VLACVFAAPEVWKSLEGRLRPDDFFTPNLRSIWESMARLAAADRPIDLVTVRDELENRGELERVGGSGVVATLAVSRLSAVNLESYVEIVLRDSRRRRVLELGASLQQSVWEGNGDGVESALARAKLELGHLEGGVGAGEALVDAASIRLDALGWLDQEAPPVKWVIPDWLPLGEVGVVAAAGGSSKTWLLLQLAIGVASASPVCDGGLAGAFWEPSQPRNVLMLSAEERREDLWRRLRRCAEAANLSPWARAEVGRRLHLHSVRGLDNLLMMQEPTTRSYVLTAQARRVEALCQSIPDLGLVVLDPVSRFRPGEETNNEAASAFVGWLERLSESCGATVLVAAHAAKAAKGMQELSQGDVRGASALVDGVRWVLMLRRTTADEAKNLEIAPEEARRLIQASLVKANNVPAKPAAWLERLTGGTLQLTTHHWSQVDRIEASYKRVLPKVQEFLREEAQEGASWSLRELERTYGGEALRFEVSERGLRGIVQKGLERGALIKLPGDKLGVPD